MQRKVQYAFGEYVGEFDESTQRRHGRGTMIYTSSRNYYEGEWRQGEMHGQGTKRYANGDVYTGSWQHGKRHGAGEYRYAGGHVFTGEYREDQCEGRGVMVLAHGAGTYDGGWAAGRKHGRGVERSRNPRVRYEGSFARGMRHGFGVLIDEEVEEELLNKTSADDDGEDDDGLEYPTSAAPAAATKHTNLGTDPARCSYETQWHEGVQIAGPPIEEQILARQRRRAQEQQQRSRGPIADAAMLNALRQAGVAQDAIEALGAFSTGVERSFGALDKGVQGMESHIGQLVGTLDALLGQMDEEEEAEEDGREDPDDDDDGLEYK